MHSKTGKQSFALPRVLAIMLGCVAATSFVESTQADISVNQAAQENTVKIPVLTRDDNGKSAEVHVGDKFIVRLDESPTTGYTWAVKSDGGILMLEASDYSPAFSNRIGGGGTRTFHFLARKSGATKLVIKLLREWEGEASAIDTFSVDIRTIE